MLKRSKVRLKKNDDSKRTCEQNLEGGRTEEVLLWVMYVVSRLQPGAPGKVLWKTVLVDR